MFWNWANWANYALTGDHIPDRTLLEWARLCTDLASSRWASSGRFWTRGWHGPAGGRSIDQDVEIVLIHVSYEEHNLIYICYYHLNGPSTRYYLPPTNFTWSAFFSRAACDVRTEKPIEADGAGDLKLQAWEEVQRQSFIRTTAPGDQKHSSKTLVRVSGGVTVSCMCCRQKKGCCCCRIKGDEEEEE